MKRLPLICFGSLVFVMSLQCGSAAIVHTLHLLTLTNSAELIVAGRVEHRAYIEDVVERRQGGTEVRFRRMLAELSVRRTLKGDPLGPRVQFEFLQGYLPSSGHGNVSLNQYGMFFLKRDTSGYVVADHVYPAVVASPESPESSGTPFDLVVHEVGYVLLSSTSSEVERTSAFWALWGAAETAQVRALFRTVAGSDSPFRFGALTALLRTGDESQLPRALDILIQPSKDASEEQRKALAQSIQDGFAKPRFMPVLRQLLKAPDTFTRQFAVVALGHTESPAAIEPLLEALEDKNPSVRRTAMDWLAGLTRKFEGHSECDQFREEEKLLECWREWSRTRRGN